MEQILSIVVESIRAQYCDPNSTNIDLDETLDQLGLDSLDAVELVMDLEKQFSIKLPDLERELLNYSPNQIASYLYQLLHGYQPTLGPNVTARFCFDTTEQMLKYLMEELGREESELSGLNYVVQENRHYRVSYSRVSGLKIIPLV